MSTTLLGGIARIVRGQDWWFYKIPPLLAVAYATWLVHPTRPREAVLRLCLVLAAICMVACYGYVINDIFDIDEDRRSGKRNRMAEVAAAVRPLLCVVPLGIGFVLLSLAGPDPIAFALLGLNYLLPTLYSVPPVRLKERGVFGVLADAGAAHGVPTALIVTTLAPGTARQDILYPIFLLSALGWAVFSGLRGIIVHQVADRLADQRAGVETFGGRLGRERARALTFRGILPCEVASLSVFLWIVVPRAPVVGAFVLVYALAEVLKIRAGWKLPMFHDPAVSQEPYVPLLNNEFYEVWLPLGSALQLALVRTEFLALAAFQLLAFLPNLRARFRPLGPLFGFRKGRKRLESVAAPTASVFHRSGGD